MKIEVKLNDTLDRLDHKYICSVLHKDKYVAFYIKNKDAKDPKRLAVMIDYAVNAILTNR